jgi:hypothetical protein
MKVQRELGFFSNRRAETSKTGPRQLHDRASTSSEKGSQNN